MKFVHVIRFFMRRPFNKTANKYHKPCKIEKVNIKLNRTDMNTQMFSFP